MTSEELRASFKYLFPDELPALKQLAESLPPNPVIVNIGAGAGTSGLAFMESRPDVILYTIDIQDSSSPFGCLEAERNVFASAGFPKEGQVWEQMCNDSHLAGVCWREADYPSVDMVFIDGDHSYDGCKDDIMLWIPNLKPGGIMAVHDYQKAMIPDNPDGPHPRPWPGVDRAVDEFLIGKYEEILRVDSLIAFRV